MTFSTRLKFHIRIPKLSSNDSRGNDFFHSLDLWILWLSKKIRNRKSLQHDGGGRWCCEITLARPKTTVAKRPEIPTAVNVAKCRAAHTHTHTHIHPFTDARARGRLYLSRSCVHAWDRFETIKIVSLKFMDVRAPLAAARVFHIWGINWTLKGMV